MSDPQKDQPDEDLLEFLGGIDEANDESKDPDEDFSDFLAKVDIDHIADRAKPPKSSDDEKKHE